MNNKTHNSVRSDQFFEILENINMKKTDAARIIGCSRSLLDKWQSNGLMPAARYYTFLANYSNYIDYQSLKNKVKANIVTKEMLLELLELTND